MPTGGRVELLLLHPARIAALRSGARRAGSRSLGRRGACAPARALRSRCGRAYGSATVVAELEDGMREIEFALDVPFEEFLERAGRLPLPPYIHNESAEAQERYQTVFARVPGSVAAPTASLHFTPDVLAAHRKRAASRSCGSTLDVGLGTFRPMRGARRRAPMHAERTRSPRRPPRQSNARAPKGGRIVAAGTTVVRALEGSFQKHGRVVAGEDATDTLYPARLCVSRGRCDDHEFPSAAVDAAGAGQRVRRSRAHPARVCRGRRAALPVLFVRRCDVHRAESRRMSLRARVDVGTGCAARCACGDIWRIPIGSTNTPVCRASTARYEPQPQGGSRRFASLKQGPLTFEWEERPTIWRVPEYFAVERLYMRGPLKRFLNEHDVGRTGTGSHARRRDGRSRSGVDPDRRVAPARRRDRQTRSESRVSPGRKARRARGAAFREAVDLGDFAPLLAADIAPEVAGAIAGFVAGAEDRDLVRMRPYELADRWSLPRREVLRAFLTATRRGLFNLSWSVICSGCRGPSEGTDSLDGLQARHTTARRATSPSTPSSIARSK